MAKLQTVARSEVLDTIPQFLEIVHLPDQHERPNEVSEGVFPLVAISNARMRDAGHTQHEKVFIVGNEDPSVGGGKRKVRFVRRFEEASL